jgi:hypothetical protein
MLKNRNIVPRSAQKTIDREVSHVQSAVADVEKALKSSSGDLPALLAVVEERLGECVGGFFCRPLFSAQPIY